MTLPSRGWDLSARPRPRLMGLKITVSTKCLENVHESDPGQPCTTLRHVTLCELCRSGVIEFLESSYLAFVLYPVPASSIQFCYWLYQLETRPCTTA
jgi:hypothetical protein